MSVEIFQSQMDDQVKELDILQKGQLKTLVIE